MTLLHSSMQCEDTIDDTIAKCRMFTLTANKLSPPKYVPHNLR